MSEEQPSKVKANLNYYTGAAQETIGNLIGNESLKASGQAAQARGNAEYEAATKEAPPSKLTGNYNVTTGSIKETVGSTIGNPDFERSGAEQRRRGNEELDEAKMSDYVSGASNKIKGSVQEHVGATLGNKRMEAEGNATKVKGETEMNKNE